MNSNNNNVIVEDKVYHHNHYENQKRKELREEQVHEIRSLEQGQQLMLPVVVTVCLAPHEQCTGKYIDTTHSFRLQCFCECHLKRRASDNLVGRITK